MDSKTLLLFRWRKSSQCSLVNLVDQEIPSSIPICVANWVPTDGALVRNRSGDGGAWSVLGRVVCAFAM